MYKNFYNIIQKNVRSGLYQIQYHHETNSVSLEAFVTWESLVFRVLGKPCIGMEQKPHEISEFLDKEDTLGDFSFIC